MEPGANTFVGRLPPEDWEALAAMGTRLRYPKGTQIYRAGDSAHEVIVVLDGHAKAIVNSIDGREVILSVLSAGALLGEISAVDGGVRSASVEALSEIEVLALRSDTFDDFLLEHARVARDLARVLAKRLRHSDERQLEFGVGDSLGRLCRRLIELADRLAVADESGTVSFESPLSQAELGSWSGLSREAIVKSMKSLRDLGWIDNSGRTITLLDPDAVRQRADV